MTLKQFFQVAGGAIVALIFYALPFPVYIKWPLIVLSAISGAAFAFLPIQDRPLEQWLLAFFRSIYSPTIFVWNAQASSFPYFKEENMGQPTAVPQLQDSGQVKQEEASPEFVKNLDEKETGKLEQIANMMDSKPVQVQEQVQEQMPRGEMIGADTGDITEVQSEKLKIQNEEKPKEELIIPQDQRIGTEKKGFEVPQEVQIQEQVQARQLGEVFNAQNTQGGIQAQFSQEASPPMKPTQANVLVGQVMDANGKIVEGAILEVKDKMGIPVRALKTNKAGHFMTVTPLPNGLYNVNTEKEGLTFDPISIELRGEIIEPLAIKAK